jgi:glycosyltransferase 2 family protein
VLPPVVAWAAGGRPGERILQARLGPGFRGHTPAEIDERSPIAGGTDAAPPGPARRLGARVARALRQRSTRIALAALAVAALVAAAVWAAPDLRGIATAFQNVRWRWVAAAGAANLVSIVARAAAWRVVLAQALPPRPRRRHVLSAYSIGMLGNAILPGRLGEAARTVVLARHLRRGRGAWATVGGTVLAHRLLDVLPLAALVVYVLIAARIPPWATTGISVTLAVGAALLVLSVVLARRGGPSSHGIGRVRSLLVFAREGMAVLRAPRPAATAALLQCLGWAAQLTVVDLALRAFGLHVPLAAAGLVLLVMNAALAFPLWPGSVGVLQAAVALSLLPYGVDYAAGFAFGLGLQAIEASIGIAMGLAFLGREGLSLAALRRAAAAEHQGNGA